MTFFHDLELVKVGWRRWVASGRTVMPPLDDVANSGPLTYQKDILRLDDEVERQRAHIKIGKQDGRPQS